MSSKSEDDRKFQESLGIAVGFLIAVQFLYASVPQVMGGAILGSLLGITSVVMSRALGSPLEWSRGVGTRLVILGVGVTAIYFLVDGLIGADVQMRRFGRAWDAHRGIEVLVQHPWAVLPLGGAAAAIAAGIAIWIGGRK